MRLQTRRDPNRCLFPELQRRDISAFQRQRYGRASVRALLLKSIRGSNHESHFQWCYVCASQFLRSSQIPSFCRNWKLPLGGRLHIALSGGAAISRDTQDFLTTALVTEWQSCGMCAILPPESMRYESVGLPVSSTEMKLLNLVDDGYLASNTQTKEKFAFVDPQHSLATIASQKLTVLNSFPIFTSPRNIVALSTTSPTSSHQPLSPKSFRSSLLWCSTTVRCRVGAVMNDMRSTSMLLLVLLPINPVSERMQCRSSGSSNPTSRATTSTANYQPSDYVHRNSYGDYKYLPVLWRAGVTFQYLSLPLSIVILTGSTTQYIFFFGV